MKINKVFMIFFILFLTAVFISAENTASGVNKKILILTNGSKYRKILLQTLSKKLTDLSCNVTKDDMKNQKKYKITDFDAVILLSGVQAGNPFSDTYDFIINNNYSSNIIYFCALSIKDAAWGKKLDKSKIDAITAASDSKNIQEVTGNIIKKLNEKINLIK